VSPIIKFMKSLTAINPSNIASPKINF